MMALETCHAWLSTHEDKVVSAAEVYQLLGLDFRIVEIRTTAILIEASSFGRHSKKTK